MLINLFNFDNKIKCINKQVLRSLNNKYITNCKVYSKCSSYYNNILLKYNQLFKLRNM